MYRRAKEKNRQSSYSFLFLLFSSGRLYFCCFILCVCCVVFCFFCSAPPSVLSKEKKGNELSCLFKPYERKAVPESISLWMVTFGLFPLIWGITDTKPRTLGHASLDTLPRIKIFGFLSDAFTKKPRQRRTAMRCRSLLLLLLVLLRLRTAMRCRSLLLRLRLRL